MLEDVPTQQQRVVHVPAVFDAGGDGVLGPGDADDEVDDRARTTGLQAPDLTSRCRDRPGSDFRGQRGVDARPCRPGVGLGIGLRRTARPGNDDFLDVADERYLTVGTGIPRACFAARNRQAVGESLDAFMIDTPAGPLDGELSDVRGRAEPLAGSRPRNRQWGSLRARSSRHRSGRCRRRRNPARWRRPNRAQFP